jgi:hypothetical protein
MMNRRSLSTKAMTVLFGLLLPMLAPTTLRGEPTRAAVSAFNAYSHSVEARLAQQHLSPIGFVVAIGTDPARAEVRLRRGELIVEQLAPPTSDDLSGALLHHWRGTAFAPGAKVADFERLMRSLGAYPRIFSPQVLQARTLLTDGDHVQAWMRVRQHHVITVVMDSTYDIHFLRLDAQHGYSISHSMRIDEIAAPGTPSEHVLQPKDEHGFLWRMNTYWSYEERDGGLYLQIEVISLTRSVPTGLGWMVEPYLESIPRESLEFTLRSACNALHP